MARMTPADRRAAIVDAALQVILRKGLAATTVRDIAEHLGCSSGLVHHYFESMDDLLAEAFAQAAAADLASARAAAELGADPIDRLRRFIASYSRAEANRAQDWSFQLWLDAWSEAVRRPSVGRTSRRLNEQWHALLAELITDARDAGMLTSTDPGTTAWTLLSLLDGLALQAVAHPGTIDRGSVIAWASAVAERELGLAPGTLLAPA